jgi:hypothetical protein
MTNGLPSSAAAGAASAFFVETFGFNAKENAGFTAGTEEAAAAAAAGVAVVSFVAPSLGAAATAAVAAGSEGRSVAAAAASKEDSGFSLISCTTK